MLPRILADDNELGFQWAAPDGQPTSLADLTKLPDAEPDRWLPTHLEALDDLLIEVAGRYGEVLGGSRSPGRAEQAGLAQAYVAIDRACTDYAQARQATGSAVDVRAGQILGTAALLSIRCREPLGLMAPAPFDGTLDRPAPGMVGGRAGLHWVDESVPWHGARWLVVTQDGLRLPATLSMLLFDSSGVDKEAAQREHADALRLVTTAVDGAEDPMVASGAVDWLLFDWLMAHRDSPDSGAIQISAARSAEATLVADACAASARVRSLFDTAL